MNGSSSSPSQFSDQEVDRVFDKLTNAVHSVLYDESRWVMDRLTDAVCGGLVIGLRETGSSARALELLDPEASADPAYAYQVEDAAQTLAAIRRREEFKVLFEPGLEADTVIDALAQIMFKLFRQIYEQEERGDSMKELAREVLVRGLVFALVIWRDQPELAARLAGNKSA